MLVTCHFQVCFCLSSLMFVYLPSFCLCSVFLICFSSFCHPYLFSLAHLYSFSSSSLSRFVRHSDMNLMSPNLRTQSGFPHLSTCHTTSVKPEDTMLEVYFCVSAWISLCMQRLCLFPCVFPYLGLYHEAI